MPICELRWTAVDDAPVLRSNRWSRPSLTVAAALIVLVVGLLIPGSALADPLAETEPNNDALHANGPFGVDGWTQTINVSDDRDYVMFRLQGGRQVSLTGTVLAGSCNSFVFAEADGSNSRSILNFSPRTVTWTTPRDATEYIGRIGGGTGCSSVIKAAPADALIAGPLPLPTYNRTLAVVAPGEVDQDVEVPITVSGVAADEDQVQAQWRTGGCPAAPDTSSGGRIVRGPKLASGPYNVTLTTSSPDTPGPATLCTWLYDTLGKLQPLLRQQTVAVVPPPVDNDRDGFVAGPDCNDNDAAIKPGAREIRGNTIDENCDGVAEPYPQAPGIASLASAATRSGVTRLRSLTVRQISRAYSVSLRCAGGGCRSKANGTFRPKPGTRTVSLTRQVNGLRLRPGATLTVKVFRSGYRSRVFRFTMRRGQVPSRSLRCASPGSSATVAC